MVTMIVKNSPPVSFGLKFDCRLLIVLLDIIYIYTMASQLAHQKRLADLESDRLLLERLASERSHLKQAQESASSSWVSTRGGSFLLLSKERVDEVIKIKQDDVDKEIRDVCGRIKEATQR